MILRGDCLDILEDLPASQCDSLVTDPPAGIAFMNKEWDRNKGGRDQWIEWMTKVMKECFRVMKPGAHGLIWALPRTSHWTATALENAGFDIRDVVTHLFGSGFPKSHDVSKAIDKMKGEKREVVGLKRFADGSKARVTQNLGGNSFLDPTSRSSNLVTTAPSSPEAKQWDGFGTSLKPASEHYILVRKPLEEKTVAKNVLRFGVGGINIGQTRVKHDSLFRDSKTPSLSILDNAYACIPKSSLDSFSGIVPLRFGQIQDFVSHIFSVLDSCNIDDKVFWRSFFSTYRNLCNESSGVLCDYGDHIEHVVAYGQSSLKSQDSQSYYPILSHFYDGLFHATEETAQDVFPLLRDVQACISSIQPSKENSLMNDNSLHLVCVWVFAWCLYKTILQDIQSPGRFPANLLLSHSENCEPDQCDMFCPVKMLDDQSGPCKTGGKNVDTDCGSSIFGKRKVKKEMNTDKGSGASRFFARFKYQAKASKSERNAGLEGFEEKSCGMMEDDNYPIKTGSGNLRDTRRQNHHPCVKPIKLMQYLCRLVTPPGGTVLDPFTGSGSTAVACAKEGFKFLGIEKETEYADIAQARYDHAKQQ